jgi:hypothetical protein
MSKLWMIERDITDWSDDDVVAGGVRAKMCVLWYPDMQWVRTFFDREAERLICIYRAESADDVRKHAEMAGLPCSSIVPVDEVLAADLDDPTEGDVARHTLEMERPPLQVEPAERA